MNFSSNSASSPVKKNILTVIGAITILLLLAIIYVFLFFDPLFRQVLLDQINKQSNVKVSMVGKISLNILGGIGISARNIVVQSSKDDRMLLAVGSLGIKTELLPLLRKQIKVTRGRIERPVAFIYSKSLDRHAQAPNFSTAFSPILIANPGSSSFPAKWQKQIIKFLNQTDLHLKELVVEKAGAIIRSENNLSVDPGIYFSFRMQMDRPSPDKLDISLESLKIDQGNSRKYHQFALKGPEETPKMPTELRDIYGQIINPSGPNPEDLLGGDANRIPLNGSFLLKDLLSRLPRAEFDLEGASTNALNLDWIKPLLSPSAQKTLRKTQLKTQIKHFHIQGNIPLDDLKNTERMIHKSRLQSSLELHQTKIIVGDVQLSAPMIEGNTAFQNGSAELTFRSSLLDGEIKASSKILLEKDPVKNKPVLNIIKSRVEIKDIKLKKSIYRNLRKGVPIAGNLSGWVTFQGLPHQRETLTAEGVLLGKKMVFTAPARGHKEKGQQLIGVPALTVRSLWKKGQINLEAEGDVLRGHVNIKGAVLPAKLINADDPQINVQVQIKGIKLDGTAPLGKGDFFPTTGTFSAEVGAKGPLSQKDLYIKGFVIGEGGILMGVPKQRHRAEKLRVDIKSSSHNKTILNVGIDHFSINKFPIRKLTGNVELSPNVVKLKPLKLKLKHGEIGINGTYHLSKKYLTTSIEGKNLFAEDLLEKYLKGQFQFSSKLEGNFQNIKSISKKEKHSLPIAGLFSGSLGFKVLSGQVKQLGVAAPLFTLIAPDKPKETNDNLSFDLLSGDFHIHAGNLTTKNLKMKKTEMELKAMGLINFNEGTLEGTIESLKRGGKKNSFAAYGNFLKPVFIAR